MSAKPVKISVTLTVTVDPEAWEMTYGDFSREDVRGYVLEYVQGSAAADEGCILEATVKGA